MATTDSVRNKIVNLISQSNALTNREDADLTTAVGALSRGYEKAPIPYNEAADGDLIYTAYFGSRHTYHPMDMYEPVDDGGTVYNTSGDPIEYARSGEYHKNLASEDAKIPHGDMLQIKKGDTSGVADHRYMYRFPYYNLENKTYTYELEYYRNYAKRHKFYFAAGTFINLDDSTLMQACGCDVRMPGLAIQLQEESSLVRYLLVRQSSVLYSCTDHIHNNRTQSFTYDDNNEFTAKLKIVLKGGARKNVTLYDGNGETPISPAYYWVGDVIPVEFAIYHVVDGQDMLIADGGLYQPAAFPLTFGIGDYDVMTAGQYYGVRDLKVYKGDTVNGGANMITFSTPSGTYTCPQGYTWLDFINDPTYNTEGFFADYTCDYSSGEEVCYPDCAFEADGTLISINNGEVIEQKHYDEIIFDTPGEPDEPVLYEVTLRGAAHKYESTAYVTIDGTTYSYPNDGSDSYDETFWLPEGTIIRLEVVDHYNDVLSDIQIFYNGDLLDTPVKGSGVYDYVVTTDANIYMGWVEGDDEQASMDVGGQIRVYEAHYN